MSQHEIIPVTGDVHWIGVLDHDIVTFDIVMETKYGTTYNSYFIDAGKKTIVETVKDGFYDLYLSKIKQLTDPSQIEYIVVNHTEPDHSGSLRHLLRLAPQATVVGSGNAIRFLQDITGLEFRSLQVKDGDTLDLGNKTLRFIGAPNLHWPDTMFTYLEEDQLLFTCDSFGAHFCNEKMFDDAVGNFDESFKYYFDVILKPFSRFMLKAIEKIRPLPVRVICPGHGPILRSHWRKYVDLSAGWAAEYLKQTETEEWRVLIAYVSAYGYTAAMAQAIAAGLKKSGGIEVELADIEMMSAVEMERLVIRSNAILVGSPTINQNTLMPVYKLFSVMNPLRDKGKVASSFGSYGWSGEAVKIIDQILRNLKLDVMDGVAFKFHPGEAQTRELENFGMQFASQLKKKAKQGM